MRAAVSTKFALLAFLLMAAAPLRAQFEIRAWPAGKPAPAIATTDLDGQAWNNARLRGRVVLLNFWATWCEPCRTEMPALVQRARTAPPGRLMVLAVNFQESAARVQRFQVQESLPNDPAFVTVLDLQGTTTRAWTRSIFPTTVVIGADGKPRHVVTGQYDWTSPDADRLLAPLMQPVVR